MASKPLTGVMPFKINASGTLPAWKMRVLEAIGSNENLLESELECLTKVLSNPAHYIHFEPKHLRLNTMNVLVNESSTDRVADVDFSVAQLSGTPPMRRAFVLARVARSEMPPPPQINFGDAARYL